MPADYIAADQTIELAFHKLGHARASLGFPEPSSLATKFSELATGKTISSWTVNHQNCSLLATAGIEMWHRAIHSFLLSVYLTDGSPIWASIAGYYSSHYVMRAFANSMGFFQSFKNKLSIQVVPQEGGFVCTELKEQIREHNFYWKVVKEHPKFITNPLFRENHERRSNNRSDESDAMHRNFASYTDHINNFRVLSFLSAESVFTRVTRISHFQPGAVDAPVPQRKKYPDIENVQILAFQRIVEFHDFIEAKFPENRFWRAHRRPIWCNKIMLYQVEKGDLEDLEIS